MKLATNGYSNRIRRLGIALLLGLAVWFLLWDATTSVLLPRDAATGRAMGCYTTVELMVGVKHPGVIRLAELALGLCLVLAAVALRPMFIGRRRTVPRDAGSPEPRI